VSRLQGLLLPAAFLLLAELILRISGIRSDALAPPSAVAMAFVRLASDGSLAVATAETLGAALLGLAIGGAGGLLCGIILGLSRAVSQVVSPTMEMLRPIPSIALIPLSLLVFGFGLRMEVAIIGFATFWPVLILARGAVRQIEPRLLEVARVLRLGPVARVSKIILPAALPRMVVALRLALGVALVVSVTVEIVANPRGLGHGLMMAQQALRPDAMLAMLAWVGVLGWGINALLLGAERMLPGSSEVPR